MPAVSVIIPTYNREKFVPCAINSVLSQTFNDYEIIVVDDGSTDNTRKTLKTYEGQITYVYQNNRGVSSARNRGILQSKGEWIAFLDSDDEWLPEYLLTHLEHIKKNQTVCLSITNSIQIRNNGAHVNTFEDNKTQLNACFKEGKWLTVVRPLEFVLKHHITNLQATIMRRQALLDAGLFDQGLTIAEDLDVMARVSLYGALAVCNKPLVNIFRRQESIKNLTDQLYSNALKSQQAFGDVYEKLRKQKNLTHKELVILDQIRSANRRAIGNLLVQTGELDTAREYYKQSLLIDPSIRSLGKYLISFLPASAIRRSIKFYT